VEIRSHFESRQLYTVCCFKVLFMAPDPFLINKIRVRIAFQPFISCVIRNTNSTFSSFFFSFSSPSLKEIIQLFTFSYSDIACGLEFNIPALVISIVAAFLILRGIVCTNFIVLSGCNIDFSWSFRYFIYRTSDGDNRAVNQFDRLSGPFLPFFSSL
jgi:hypothetical protein